jgi:superfamily II DNA or RNA helicase
MNKDQQIQQLQNDIDALQKQLDTKKLELAALQADDVGKFDSTASPNEKIALFRSLFKGREDVYARRFESVKTGKSGYQPACGNEWVQGKCDKPRKKCSDCGNKEYLPVTDDVIRFHLTGVQPPLYPGGTPKPFVAGVYPMLTNETCWFLAIDFDKEKWIEDVRAFQDTCEEENIPAYLERSRSGNGGHIWIFFDQPVFARIARNLGSALMTKTLDKRPEVGLDSFDRFFPNQDTMPRGGIGNLIALPLQKAARDKNHSVFLDREFNPYPDQWAFLASVNRMKCVVVEQYVNDASRFKELLPVSFDQDVDDENDEPWKRSTSNQYPSIDAVLPKKVGVTLSNQIFVESTGLPAVLRNRICRLASFSNPEFYQAQAMRLPTWGKPRILHCYDYFKKYIALPVGCLDDLKRLLNHYRIRMDISDERNKGKAIDIDFLGELYPEQDMAAKALLAQETGVLSATTAFGKTVVALSMIAERKVNTLILVHRKQLMDQWFERIGQFLSIPEKKVGRFGGGRKKRTGIIDIAVIQSVCHKGEVKEWVREYGQVIVDECHHVSAFSFEQSIRQSDAFYKHGLSATLRRKDGQHPIIFMNLGQVSYTVNARKQAAERSFEHIVQVVPTAFTVENPEKASENIQDLFRGLWQNEQRNNQIIADVKQAHAEGKQILVLSERTEHLEVFKDALQDTVEHLFLLKGGLGQKQLKAIMSGLSDVREDESRVILATGRYLGEGFDLPALDTLFLTFPISWKGTLAQYAGRLHREHHGKTEVRIYDYVDTKIPVLQRMHEKRQRGYYSLGYTIADSKE